MSLRILFADDSVTAQNMGRKILTDAGYEVVAVSNGAAAVKKIAEQKPDIIILDVYMPGYSGLEVCEKVRGSIETLKTPVLLTVGKMEPYKPEEANRVRADGVIVKPFEASDLLAIVKKFEERIGQASVPTLVQPILVERFHETPVPPMPHAQELPVEQPEPALLGSTPQPTVEVPDHMATSSAFSDLLNAEAAHIDNSNAAPTSPIAARPSTIEAPLPDYDIPVSWRREALPEPTVITAPAAAVNPEPAPKPAPVPAAVTPALPLPIRPRPIPVYQEPKERSPLELVPTAVPPTGEIEIPREPELQETAAEATRNTVAENMEPGLMPTLHQEEEEPLGDPIAREAAELAPVEAEAIFSRLHEVAPASRPVPGSAEVAHTPLATKPVRDAEPVERKVAESDFEERVAAAMAAYNSAAALHEDKNDSTHASASPVFQESPVAGLSASEPLETPVRLAPESEPLESSIHVPAIASVAAPAIAGRIGEEPAPVTERGASVAAPVALRPESGPGASPVVQSEVDFVARHDAASASVEAALPATVTPAVAETGADHHTIAQAVHRVMERLKPELVEEIVRELKAKK